MLMALGKWERERDKKITLEVQQEQERVGSVTESGFLFLKNFRCLENDETEKNVSVTG